MKATELSIEDLEKRLKELKLSQMKTYGGLGKENISKKEAGMSQKGDTRPGQKTKMQKEIRRNIARIKTIINEKSGNNEEDNNM